jgi:hypothetical protein
MFVVKRLKMVSMNRTSTLVSGSIHSSKISDLSDLFEMYAKKRILQIRYSDILQKKNWRILFYFIFFMYSQFLCFLFYFVLLVWL